MDFLTILQVIIAILLIVVILLQSRGASTGGLFGGGSGGSNAFSTKRGVEKVLFRSTIVLALLFVGVALVNLVR